MRNTSFQIVGVFCFASMLTACHDLSSDTSYLMKRTKGVNSINGSVHGIRADSQTFDSLFDYSVTTNDGHSFSQSWLEPSGRFFGDSVLWIGQYFFADRNGPATFGNELTSSGKYIYLSF